MSELEFESYLKLLSGLLRLSPGQRELIATELRDHMEERLRALIDAGMPREEAVGVALEEFGDAAALAANFRHIAWNRKRRKIMRWTTVSVCAVLTAILAATAFWPESENGPGLNRAVAQNQNAQDDAAVDDAVDAAQAVDEVPTMMTSDERNDATRHRLANTRLAWSGTASLGAFLDYVAATADVQYHLDIEEIELAGQYPDDEKIVVDFSLNDVRSDMLLDLVLSPLDLGYYVRDGILIITSSLKAESQIFVRVYDCEDLIATDPVFSREVERPISSQTDAEPFVFGGGAVMHNAEFSLIGVITCSSERADNPRWHSNGGAGTIRRYHGKLVIAQTEEVHEEIEYLLERLNDDRRFGRGTQSQSPSPQ